MPWKAERGHGCEGDTPWAVIKTTTGEKVSCHASGDDANAQVRLLYAKEGQRMTTDAPEAASPLDAVPEWVRPLLPNWAQGGLRYRAVELDDLHILERAKGGDGRTVEAYAAVFGRQAEVRDQDGHYMEQISRVAFDKSIRERASRIGVYYNHAKTLYGTPSERWSVPLGVPVLLRADARGLLTHTRYDPTPDAEQILAGIKSGSIRGMSFTGGFLRSDPQAGPYYARSNGDLTLVTRQEIALVEYGPTPIPTYDDAEIVGVRSGQLDAEDDGQRAAVDRPWDAGANVGRLSNDAGAATYRRMFALHRSGADPDLKGSYALPHHEVSTDGQVGAANLAGVRNALSRLPQTKGFSQEEKDAAERHLRAHLPASSPASQGPTQGRSDTVNTLVNEGITTEQAIEIVTDQQDSAAHRTEDLEHDAAQTPAAHSTGDTDATKPEQEPPTHSQAPGTPTKPATEPASTSGRSAVADQDVQQTMTAQERAVRQGEIRSRMNELANQFNGAEMDEESQTEWDDLGKEFKLHERAIQADTARRELLAEIGEEQAQPNGGGERVSNRTAGYGQRAPYARVQRPDNIFDLAEIRNRARSIDELPALYRDNAMRAIEQSRFPGATGQRGAPSREQAQERIATLLDTIDDEQGTLARRILVTGSPTYDRAFGKMIARQSIGGLTTEESRALSLGTDSAGGYAVPFQLDPTVILSSNGVVNPLRAISRVETITGKEWDGVTSAGVTVSRGTEAQEVGTGDPAFVQPTVRTSRVQGWVPFSVELDVTWNALRTQLTNLLQDAKDVEEATAFATGNGTAPNPSGVVSTLGTASWVDTAGSAVLAAGDIYLLENAMAPRFIANSRIVASKTTFNRFRTLFQAQASAAGDPFARPSGGMGPTFNDYPKHELSTMATGIGTGALIMLQGDFNQFLIVDRVGMGIELVPHVLGSNRRPTGERGVYALWFNNSKILVDNAFRLLRIKST